MNKEPAGRGERHAWLRLLVERVNPGVIAEFGCGTGAVLETLHASFPQSTIIGVDKSEERLREVVHKRLARVIPILSDISQRSFMPGSFDTILFVGSLHEVFSCLGKENVERSLEMGYRVLRSGGVALIQDFLKPGGKKAQLTCRNKGVEERFLRFVREFRGRKVKAERMEGGFLVDIADGVEFISKYRSSTEEDWEEEMAETHFFFTQDEYKGVAEQIGFSVEETRGLTKSPEWWSEVSRDLVFERKSAYRWVHLVLRKS